MSINFRNEVINRFSFLEQRFGFKLEARSENERYWEEVIAYVSPTVALEVFRSFEPQEIGVRFKEAGSNDHQTWDIATYLKLIDKPSAASFGYSIASNDDEIIELLEKYAAVLQGLASEIIRGSKAECARFREALITGKGLESLGKPTRFTGR
jgi:hypothetical protein